jgi:hypothetical protein
VTAELYIIPESFENNLNMSKGEIEKRIKVLAQDFILIRKYKDSNKIYVNHRIYTVVFIGGIVISDLLYNTEVLGKYIDRDARLALKIIIEKSAKTELSIDEITDRLLPNHNEEICYGIIAFNKMENIGNRYQIVYNVNDWFDFRRYFLSLYPHPHDGDYFIEECKKYFPNLFFHERNKNTVTYLLKDSSKKVVYHLAALNDKFKESYQPEYNRTQILNNFSSMAKLDEAASLEGNIRRKEALTFSFVNDKGQPENVYCEAHLKLCYNDSYPGDTSYSNDRRIYFHEGKPNIQQGKILIGHMGDHL